MWRKDEGSIGTCQVVQVKHGLQGIKARIEILHALFSDCASECDGMGSGSGLACKAGGSGAGSGSLCGPCLCCPRLLAWLTSEAGAQWQQPKPLVDQTHPSHTHGSSKNNQTRKVKQQIKNLKHKATNQPKSKKVKSNNKENQHENKTQKVKPQNKSTMHSKSKTINQTPKVKPPIKTPKVKSQLKTPKIKPQFNPKAKR